MTDTVDITPTWRGVAHAIELGLTAGTGKGQQLARGELNRMADMLDHLGGCFRVHNCFDDSLVAYALSFPDAVNIAQGLADRWSANHQVTGKYNGEDITLIRTPKPIRLHWVYTQKIGSKLASGGPRWRTALVYCVTEDGRANPPIKLRAQFQWTPKTVEIELRQLGKHVDTVTELEG